MRIVVLGATGYVGSRLVPGAAGGRPRRGRGVVLAGRPRPVRLGPRGDVAAVRRDRRRRGRAGAARRRRRLLPGAQPEPPWLRRPRPGRRGARARRGVGQPAYAASSTSPDWSPCSAADRRSRPTSRPGSRSSRCSPRPDCSTLSVRAGVVIGAGSTSYEVVRQLASLLLVQPVPTWMRTWSSRSRSTDVLRALVAAFEEEAPEGDVDLGGPDVLPYPELLAAYARAARLPRLRVPALVAPVDRGRAVHRAAGRRAVPDRHRARREPAPRHGVPPRPHVAAGRRPMLGVDEALARAVGPPGPRRPEAPLPERPRLDPDARPGARRAGRPGRAPGRRQPGPAAAGRRARRVPQRRRSLTVRWDA